MRSTTILKALAIAAALAAPLAPAAQAGSAADQAPLYDESRTEALAQRVERSLAQRGVQVAIVGRIGRPRDELPQGIRYTHVGLWVYSTITEPNGAQRRGYAVHNLYQYADNPDRSTTLQDFPADFFRGVQGLEAGVIAPKPELQAKLLMALNSGAFQRLHNPNYSVLANPNDHTYQNCTEHMLDFVASALWATEDQNRLKRNLRAYHTPQTIALSPIKRSLGPIFVAGVQTDDHTGPIRTTTFTTIRRFMERWDLESEVYTVR